MCSAYAAAGLGGAAELAAAELAAAVLAAAVLAAEKVTATAAAVAVS